MHSIRKDVGEKSFKTWFEPIRPISIKGHDLIIQVPDPIFYEHIEEHYVDLLRKSICEEMGSKAKLRYQIKRRSSNGRNTEKYSTRDGGIPESAPDIKNPFVIPGLKKAYVVPELNNHLKFKNFVEGDCNKLARSSGINVSKKPIHNMFNPLFIYGNVGLGKTHLAQAIGNAIHEAFPDLTLVYVTTEKFTNQVINGLRTNSIADVTNFYQLVDVLIVDDIQFLAKREKTQDIFFHIFNNLHQNGKQIILTSDRPTKELDGIRDRLISRFRWGLNADLQPPDFETRMAILHNKAEEDGIDLPDEVAEFISYNIKSNIRELQGAMTSLIAHTSLTGKKMSIDLAQSVIERMLSKGNRLVTIEGILRMVSEEFAIERDDILSKSRKRPIVVARQAAMWLSKQLTNQSLKNIGRCFGKRDHTTVMYSCRTIEDLMDTDEDFKQRMLALKKRITLSLN